MMKSLPALAAFLLFLLPLTASAQLTERRVENLETRVQQLERKVKDHGSAFLVGAVFAALWAQQTRRNAWLWFFVTLFLAPIALLVLLYKNAYNRHPSPGAPGD